MTLRRCSPEWQWILRNTLPRRRTSPQGRRQQLFARLPVFTSLSRLHYWEGDAMFRTWPAATLGLTVTLGVTGLEAKASANPIDPTTTVEIVVITHASVPAEVSDRAMLEAGRIYETAGVDVVWIKAEAAEHHPSRHLRLTFVVAAVAAAKNPDALGFAAN